MNWGESFIELKILKLCFERKDGEDRTAINSINSKNRINYH